ncbi:MAG TPA: hypothetical protein VLA72_05045 [Anaerolineales bacterium]|nr:hypothetical protein [Anaerolineales bacterium]
MNKLRVGVILPDHMVPAWVRQMLETINSSSHADISALAFADQTNRSTTSTNKQYDLHLNLDKKVFRPTPNPWDLCDIRQVIYNTQALGADLHERISRFRAMRLDLLLNLSLEDMPKSLLDVARFGAWSLRCNDVRVTTGSEIGWLEILNEIPVMHCDIEIEREETTLLYPGSVIATNLSSISLNQKSFFWRASQIVPRAFQKLHTKGEPEFFGQTKTVEASAIANVPSTAQSTSLAQIQALQTYENKVRRRITPQPWALMAGKSTEGGKLDWGRLNLKVPPRDVFWADPFLLKKQDTTYLFFEEYVYKTQRGRISYAILDESGKIGEPQVALERPYHLSYPFIFEHRGEFYMIPETAQNRAIEIFRCVQFPGKWEYHKTLMPSVQAVDATLFQYTSRWWMFVNIAHEGGSTWDELHLFYADDPLSTEWTPHPMNPIVSDVRSARPAGRLFRRDGRLIRPSQDSSLRYGYALNFNSITKLSIYEYEEELLKRIEPPNEDILAVHTYNKTDDFVVVDALLKK